MAKLCPLWARNLRRLMMDFGLENDKGVDDFTKVEKVHESFGKEKCFLHLTDFSVKQALDTETKGNSTSQEVDQFVFDIVHPKGAVRGGGETAKEREKSMDEYLEKHAEKKWGKSLYDWFIRRVLPYKKQIFGIEYNNFTESFNHVIKALFEFVRQEIDVGIQKIVALMKSQLIDIKKAIVFGDGSFGDVCEEFDDCDKRLKLLKYFKMDSSLTRFEKDRMDRRRINKNDVQLPSVQPPSLSTPISDVDTDESRIQMKVLEGLIDIEVNKSRSFEVVKVKSDSAARLVQVTHFNSETDEYKKYCVCKRENSNVATFVKVYKTSISCSDCQDPLCAHKLAVLGKFYEVLDFKKLLPSLNRVNTHTILNINNKGGRKHRVTPSNRGRKQKFRKKKNEVFKKAKIPKAFFIPEVPSNPGESSNVDQENMTGKKDTEKGRRGIVVQKKVKKRKLNSSAMKIYKYLCQEGARILSIRNRSCCGRKNGKNCNEKVCSGDEDACQCRICKKFHHEECGEAILGSENEGIDYIACGSCIEKEKFRCFVCKDPVHFDDGSFDCCVCQLKSELNRWAIHIKCFKEWKEENKDQECFCKNYPDW